MYKFQEGRWGENWQTAEEFDVPIALSDYDGELYEKYEWRLLGPDDTVIKHWVGTYGHDVYYDQLSDNPLASVFADLDINDETICEFIRLWITANPDFKFDSLLLLD